jgi:hypothetical protein
LLRQVAVAVAEQLTTTQTAAVAVLVASSTTTLPTHQRFLAELVLQ